VSHKIAQTAVYYVTCDVCGQEDKVNPDEKTDWLAVVVMPGGRKDVSSRDCLVKLMIEFAQKQEELSEAMIRIGAWRP
jgi:hypothetical protein